MLLRDGTVTSRPTSSSSSNMASLDGTVPAPAHSHPLGPAHMEEGEGAFLSADEDSPRQGQVRALNARVEQMSFQMERIVELLSAETTPRVTPVFTAPSVASFAPPPVASASHSNSKLPKLPSLSLENKHRLASHLGLCEAILAEQGITLTSLSAQTHIISSLTESMRSEAQSMLQCHSWDTIKMTLIQRYADALCFQSAVDTALSALKFSFSDPHLFVMTARSIWTSAACTSMERSTFNLAVLNILPKSVLASIVDKCPADPRFMPFMDLCSVMELVFAKIRFADFIKPPQSKFHSSESRDKVKIARPSSSAQSTGKKSWLEEWVASHPYVMSIKTRTGHDESIKKLCADHPHKVFKESIAVAFDNAAKGEEVCTKHSIPASDRKPFQLLKSQPKN